MTSASWGKQRLLKESDRPIPTYDSLYNNLRAIENPRDRALCTISYLSGGRVSEVKSITKDSFRTEFLVDKGGNKMKFMLIECRNLKNRNRKTKTLPINYDREYPFILLIKDYLESLKPGSILFPISIARIGQLIGRYFGFNPHYFRDIRLTHLVEKFGFDPFQLQVYAGWSDTRPTKNYVALDWRVTAKAY